jgi:hypothetical protein
MDSLLGLEPIIDPYEALKLLLRFALNISCAIIVVQWAYLRLYKNREFVFTFYLLNVITFCLCFLLRKVPAELGFDLAIFAVFGILRFRTEQIRIRDLTYLFVLIGVGVINAVANKSVDIFELLLVNGIIIGMTLSIEWRPVAKRESSVLMFYDKLELMKPGRAVEMLSDIQERTGLAVTHVEIESFDLLRDAVNLKVHHRIEKLKAES